MVPTKVLSRSFGQVDVLVDRLHLDDAPDTRDGAAAEVRLFIRKIEPQITAKLPDDGLADFLSYGQHSVIARLTAEPTARHQPADDRGRIPLRLLMNATGFAGGLPNTGNRGSRGFR